MRWVHLRFLLILSLLLGSRATAVSQDSDSLYADAAMERRLSLAETYLIAYKNDSTLFVIDELLKSLKRRGLYNTPFGVRAQLAEALAFEQEQYGKLAMKKLLRVAQLSEQKELWAYHVKACLALALLYEKLGRKESSRQQLERVKTIIERRELDSLYPYFAIRLASWERLFGDQKEALYYAAEALRTAPKYGLLLEEAISHMLLNRVLPPSYTDNRMKHCLAAVKIYRQLGDHTGLSSMLNAISQIQLQKKDFPRALAYSDSAISAANRAIAEGYERYEAMGMLYQSRGNIYQQMGMLDSAIVNMQKGHAMESTLLKNEHSDEVIEIDARYQNKYKQQQIEEQQLALRLKNIQLGLSAAVVVLVLILTYNLFVGYRKQRQAKQKLLEQNRLIQNQATQLANLDAAKSRFFANVSHELRTPLSLIIGPISSLLKESQRTERETMLLKTASHSARQLELLVNDILDLQELEVGEMRLDPEPTALESFFGLHLNQFESLAQWRQIHYQHEIKIAPGVVAELDREKCRQILYNLLSNAFKFTPPDGTVKVAVCVQADRLAFDVSDTGAGISDQDLPMVFDRFFQASSASGGTGIGLSICHDYTQLMGGDIRVESKPGEGSVFYVSWPITFSEKRSDLAPVASWEVDEPSENAVPLLDFGAGLPGYTAITATTATVAEADPRPALLVVEDNPGLLGYLTMILSEKYRIVPAENGQVALQKLAVEGSVDLILSDLMMPVMDGYHLLEALKSGGATRHIPVIMLTARTRQADRLKALRIGVDDYLTKPFDEEELLVRITNLLKNQSIRRQESHEESHETDTHPQLSQADQAWLENFEKYVRDNLASEVLDIPSLSENFAMSDSTLLRQLKRLTGLSPSQYLQEIRLNEARELLESGVSVSIASLASRVGYKNARTFSRNFSNRFGKLPSEFV